MNFARLGRVVRTLRRRRGWRQLDLGRRAVCSQQAISLIECGRGDRLSSRTVVRGAAQLDAELDVSIRWRGGEIERLLDEGHARLENAIASLVVAAGWEARVEVTYAIGAERGSIDVLALHRRAKALLVVEVKSDLLSAESTARKHDEKVRLGPRIAAERLDWHAATVARLLVLPESRTARRRIAGHRDLFQQLYPARGHAVRSWLATPAGSMSGILFLSVTRPGGDRRSLTSRRRVRAVRT